MLTQRADDLAEEAGLLVLECLSLLGWRSAIKATLEPGRLARALRVEQDMRRALRGGWGPKAEAVVARTASLPLTAGVMDHEAILADLVQRLSGQATSLATELAPVVGRQLAVAWGQGRRSATDVVRPAAGMAEHFELVNRSAQDWLRRDTLYWIGQHGSKFVGVTVADTVRECVVESGGGRREAARLLKERLTPLITGQFSDARWELVAAAAVTRATAYSTTYALEEAGVTTYTISNPEDEVTCPTCRYLAGKTFRLVDAVAQRDLMLEALLPEDVRTLAPWKKAAEVVGRPVPELQRQGVSLPPFHGNCRCQSDAEQGTKPGSPRISDDERRRIDDMVARGEAYPQTLLQLPEERGRRRRTVQVPATPLETAQETAQRLRDLRAKDPLQLTRDEWRQAYEQLAVATKDLPSRPEWTQEEAQAELGASGMHNRLRSMPWHEAQDWCRRNGVDEKRYDAVANALQERAWVARNWLDTLTEMEKHKARPNSGVVTQEDSPTCPPDGKLLSQAYIEKIDREVPAWLRRLIGPVRLRSVDDAEEKTETKSLGDWAAFCQTRENASPSYWPITVTITPHRAVLYQGMPSRIARMEQADHAAVHEYGHAVSSWVQFGKANSAKKWKHGMGGIFYEAVKRAGAENEHITDYAKTKIEEDFAESFKFWLQTPQRFRTKCPGKAAIMDSIFKSEETLRRAVWEHGVRLAKSRLKL